MPAAKAPLEIDLVLDTDVFTDWRFQRQKTIVAIREYVKVHKGYPALTSTTVFEALHGFEKEAFKRGWGEPQTQSGRASMEELFKNCVILPFNDEAAKIAAYIYPRVSNILGKKIANDTFIAATALAHRHGVVTRNRRDFEQISDHLPSDYSVLYLDLWKA